MAALEANSTAPLLIRMPPVFAFVPESASVNGPALVSTPVPPRLPLMFRKLEAPLNVAWMLAVGAFSVTGPAQILLPMASWSMPPLNTSAFVNVTWVGVHSWSSALLPLVPFR